MGMHGLDFSDSRLGQAVSKCGNEPWGPTKCGELLD